MNRPVPDIRFYDFSASTNAPFQFKLLHVENQFINSNWNIYYNGIGNFEAHFDLHSETLPIVMEHDYLVVVQGDQSAVVVGKKLGSDLSVFGRTSNWLLTKRITDAFDGEDTLYNLVTRQVSAAFYDSPLAIGAYLENSPVISVQRSDKGETFKFVQECLDQEHYGHEINLDFIHNKWIFQIIKGNDTNPLVISTTNRNAHDVSLEGDLLDLCTEGWYQRQMENMGEWDPTTNKVIKDEIPSGTIVNNIPSNYGKYWKVSADGTRFEMSFHQGDYCICRQPSGALQKSDNCDPFWVKISNQPSKTGICRWECLLSGSTESEALTNLSKKRRLNNIQAKTAEVFFGREYALGDIVTVEWQAGPYKKRTRKRISGVNIWYEVGNIGEEPIFEDLDEFTE